MALFNEINNVCMTERTCGVCQEAGCHVGYSRLCVGSCRKKDVLYCEDGFKNIPHADYKGGYDEEDILNSIAKILHICRSCADNHYEDCVINVVRSNMEILAFGEPHEYTGNALSYLMEIQKDYPERAAKLMQFYKDAKTTKED